MPVRRSALALALTSIAGIVAVAPSPAFAQRAACGGGGGARSWALLAGIEDETGPAGFQLRADLEFAEQRLAPAVAFAVVGSLGFSRFHDEVTDPFFMERYEASTNIVRVMPAARLTFGAHPVFRPYVDGGLGFYYASSTLEVSDLSFGGTTTFEDSEVSLFLRVAAGATFLVSPCFALGAELGLMPYLGDLDATTTSALVSATFRL